MSLPQPVRAMTAVSVSLVATMLASCSKDTTITRDATATTVVANATTSTLLAVDNSVPSDVSTSTVFVDGTIGSTIPVVTDPTIPQPPPTSPPSFTLYEVVEAPTVPAEQTTAVDPVATALGDGTYWVEYTGGDATSADLIVYHAYFGDLCVIAAEAIGDECVNDIFLDPEVIVDLPAIAVSPNVFITLSDVESQVSYRVTNAELVSAVGGIVNPIAPSGYFFTPFPFVATVEAGTIVRLEQVWVP